MKNIVEVCCGSYEDCLRAFEGGASRVELNSALHLGGLTPSIGTLKLVKRKISIPVCCMVRPRGAGFCYNELETEVIFADAKALLEAGADGIVFGFLNEDGSIEEKRNKEMIALIHAYHKEAIFHRAFDCVKDPDLAMAKLVEMGVDRVLTSGLEAKAVNGKELLKTLQAKYGSQIQILPGSGVNASNAKELMAYTGLSQVHSSCKNWFIDPTTHINPGVTYGYGGADLDLCYDGVDIELVKAIVKSVA